MSSSKNALFISYDGLTDPLGRSQILPYLEGLTKNGYSISIVSCEKKQAFLDNETEIRQLVAKAGIEWTPLNYRSSVPVWSPYFNYKALLRTAKQICINNNIQLVHCRSIIPGMVGHQLQQQFGIKFLFDIRGFWADERVEGGLWNLKIPVYKWLYLFFKKQEKLLFHSADGIITLTQKAKEHILAHFESKKQLDVIPCSVDVAHFAKSALPLGEEQQLRSSLMLDENQFVLGYIGSLGTRYLLNDMLRFFIELKKQRKDAVLLFVTKTPKDFIYSHIKELGINVEDIRITSSNYSKMPAYINLMQASIFFVSVGFSGKAVSPTKQSEVLSMGKPLVANAGLGDTDILLKENDLGVLVSSFEEESLKLAATELLESQYSKTSIRNSAIQLFSLDEAIKKYKNMYVKLLGE